MVLRRLSLDRLWLWLGITIALLVYIPSTFYTAQQTLNMLENHLVSQGDLLGTVTGEQILEPLLLSDHLALYTQLQNALHFNPAVRYLCIEDPQGRMIAHTPGQVNFAQLSRLWHTSPSDIIRFNTSHESLIDIAVPLLENQLGRLHVGMSRTEVVNAIRRLLLRMSVILMVSLFLILVGAKLIARASSRPLRQLEVAVSLFPKEAADHFKLGSFTTCEVEHLKDSFVRMSDRLRTLESERQSTQESLIHTERLAVLGELASGLAHEIRNPLDGMIECVNYLDKDTQKSPMAAKYYPMLRDGLHRISGTMQEMLKLAQSGREVSLQPCKIKMVLNEIKLLTDGQIKGHNISLSWQLEGLCVCLCDQHCLTQAILNLLLNAIDALSDCDSPKIMVRGFCDSEFVYISVDDNGPGVPEKYQQLIFDAFFSTKPRDKGTGLGLSVSRQMIRAMGGELSFAGRSETLGGARFIVRLPRVSKQEL